MSEYTPALSQLEFAYQETQERLCGTNPFTASAEFERAIAEVAKAAKVEALLGLAEQIETASESDVPNGTLSGLAANIRAAARMIDAGEGA